jgi:hypothetical protein
MKAALFAAAGLSALIVTAANGDIRVLLVGDDAVNPGAIADVRAKIGNTGRVDGVIDTFNNSAGVPTLATLNSYDVVVVWTDGALADGIGLGNVLADYVDAGGGVVEMTFGFYTTGIGIQGRWLTGGYAAMTGPSQSAGTVQTIGNRRVSSHPILDSVGTFNGGTSSYRIDATVTPGSYLIASWNDGPNTPLVATRHVNSGKVAGLNFYPPSSDVRADFWNAGTGGGVLMANAINFVSNNSVDALIIGAPVDPAWNTEVKDRVLEGGRVGGRVDVVNGSAVTPSLADLRQYDTVMVYSDVPFANSVLLGNNLADYVDSGGGVIVSTFGAADSFGYFPGGRFEAGNYAPFTLGPTNFGAPLTIGARLIPDHPLLQNVAGLNGGTSSFHSTVGLRPGAVGVANWSNGVPLLAAKPGHKGRVAGLNFYPPSSASRGDFWNASTDGAAIIGNAMNWTARNDNDVLILGDNAIGGTQADIVSKIRPTIDGTLDAYDFGGPTPSIARLRKYDSVLLYRNTSPSNNNELGDRIADFVDGGGGLVDMFASSTGGFEIGGRFSSGGYSGLLPGNNSQPGTLVMSTRHLPRHPVLAGVGGVNIGAIGAHNDGGMRPGSLRIADLSNGEPLAVERSTGSGRVVTLNFFPASNDVLGGLWLPSTDGALLMGNALNHVARSDIEALIVGTQDATDALSTDIRRKINGTSRIRTRMETFDNSAANPPLGLLLAYDSIMVWANNSQPDSTQWGNLLATYADLGGGVVTASGAHANSTFGPTGRWLNRPYTAAEFGQGALIDPNAAIGTRHQPGHPVLSGVRNFDLGPTGLHDFRNPSSIGERIADLTAGGTLAVEAKANGARQSIALNMFPVSTDGSGAGWNAATQGGLLMANALTYVTRERPCLADFNNDGFLDFFDYSDYVDCFETGSCPPGRDADFNGDGFVDFFDYSDYVAAFEQGC